MGKAMPRLKLKLRAKIKNWRVNPRLAGLYVRLRAHLVLPCSLGVGLVPPLGLLLAAALWEQMSGAPTIDARPLIWAVLVISPFAAGFAHCRQLPHSQSIAGALPAFVLWLLIMTAQRNLPGEPTIKGALISLVIALLWGVAGGMTADRMAQNKKAEE